MPVSHLADSWVLVTGAASGIGFETALAFAREHAHIVAVDINAEGLDALAQDVQRLGVRCLLRRVDVSDAQAVHDLADELHTTLGRPIDVLVNNAGVAYLGPFLHSPLPVWRRLIDVNIMGTVHMCQAFLPAMVQAGGSRQLVNVASAVGLTPSPNLSIYSATKHALIGLSDTLSMELEGTGVGVTLVCPGIINTPIVRNRHTAAAVVPTEQLDRLERHYRLRGAPPSLVGQRIVEAVQDGEDLVLAGPSAHLLFMLKRLSRGLMRRLTLFGSRQRGFWADYPQVAPLRPRPRAEAGRVRVANGDSVL
jgi:NAD(P)-dependent dehydrogenase (short-subunit alcohol dehydrogenase family)